MIELSDQLSQEN